MKAPNDPEKLAARYRSWDTEDLVRATTLEAQEYTSEAIGLMRQELQKRDLTPEAQEAVEAQVDSDAQRKQKSLVGVRGWLLVFVVLFALNFGAALVSGIFGLAQPLPAFVKLALALNVMVGFYALGSLRLLVSRHPKAPQHAKIAVVAFCFLAIGSWLAFYWVGLTPGRFPVGAVIFTCVWWSYLSYSKRVQFTYAPRLEVTTEAGVTR